MLPWKAGTTGVVSAEPRGGEEGTIGERYFCHPGFKIRLAICCCRLTGHNPPPPGWLKRHGRREVRERCHPTLASPRRSGAVGRRHGSAGQRRAD